MLNKFILPLILISTLISCASRTRNNYYSSEEAKASAIKWTKEVQKDMIARAKYYFESFEYFYYKDSNIKLKLKSLKFNREASWALPVKQIKGIDYKTQLAIPYLINRGEFTATLIDQNGFDYVFKFFVYYDLICGDRNCYNDFQENSPESLTSEWITRMTNYKYRLYKLVDYTDRGVKSSKNNTFDDILSTKDKIRKYVARQETIVGMSKDDVKMAWGRPNRTYTKGDLSVWEYRVMNSYKLHKIYFKKNKMVKDKIVFGDRELVRKGPIEDVYRGMD